MHVSRYRFNVLFCDTDMKCYVLIFVSFDDSKFLKKGIGAMRLETCTVSENSLKVVEYRSVTGNLQAQQVGDHCVSNDDQETYFGLSL